MNNVNTGKIVQISARSSTYSSSPAFCRKSEKPLSLTVDGRRYVMEVAQHVGDNTVRCVMLSGSEGLSRGMQVEARAKPSKCRWAKTRSAACSTCSAIPSTAAKPFPQPSRTKAFTEKLRRLTSRTRRRDPRDRHQGHRSSGAVPEGRQNRSVRRRRRRQDRPYPGAHPQRRHGARRLLRVYRRRRAQP